MNISAWRIEKAVSAAQQFAERLRAEDPDLDHESLALALDSETDAVELLRRVVVAAIEDDAFADAVAGRIKNLQERKARFDARAQAARGLARDMLGALELTKLTDPQFTVTLGAPRSKAVVLDQALLPDDYIITKITKTPDMTAIGLAIKNGAVPPGVDLRLAPPVLTIRTK